jgi:putative sterol carrier protein
MSLFQPSLAGDLDARFQLQLGEGIFSIEVAGGELQLARGTPDNPDATIEADPATLAEVLWHGRRLSAAERSGDVTIVGDRPAAKRLLGLFPLPEPAPA